MVVKNKLRKRLKHPWPAVMKIFILHKIWGASGIAAVLASQKESVL
jgi:hypothetical protein